MVTITERFRNDTTTVYSEDAELVWERTFDAPREVVWQAFMDPERIPQWWGPHGSTATVVEMDVRPGGTTCRSLASTSSSIRPRRFARPSS